MGEKIKLAVFTNKFPGKVNTFFSRDIIALLQHGFQIDVFTIYPVQNDCWANVPQEFRDRIRLHVNIIYVSPFHLSYNNIPNTIVQDIRQILRQARDYGFTQWFKSILVIQQALSWRKKYAGCYDYLLAYWGNYSGTYAFLANRLSKKQVPYSFFLRAGTDLYRDQIYLEQKIKSACKVFLPCKYNYNFLKSLYPTSFESFEQKLVFYYHGLDIENFSFVSHQRSQSTILTIGSLVPQKGFAYAIKALALLINDFPQLRLIMIGDGLEKSELQVLANSLGLDRRVKFTGWLPFERVKEYLVHCTLLVHPSIGEGDAEPNVIKEAMASGLPVIGASVVGIPEMLDDGRVGRLFPPKDEVALANSISILINNPDLRQQLAFAAREFVEQKYDLWKNQRILTTEIESNLKSKIIDM